MVKLLGSVLIISGGVLVRYLQALDRRRQLEALSDLLRVLRQMGEEIRMARTPLPVLLERLAAGRGEAAAEFLLAASAAARSGESLGMAWRQASEALPLQEADRASLASLGDSLHGDEEAVRKALSLTVNQLSDSLEEALRRKPEEDKRATALCLSSAALLVLLLI